MNWYRIKTVLIFLFAAINIFLAVMLGIDAFSGSRAIRERVDGAVAILEQNGVTVSAKVPYKTPRMGTLTLENPKANPDEFAARLLGGTAARFGTVWRRDGKSVTFPQKGFIYTGTAEAVPADKKSVKAMKKALEDMGFSMEYAEGTVEDGIVRFVQKVNGLPLFQYSLTVYPAGDGTVARMEGVWAEVVTAAKERGVIRDATSALLSFLQETDGNHTVTRVENGYAVFLAEEGYHTADAVPVWKVETEDGTVRFYDAR
ncbi:MAG: hypothetical protein E7408_01270 [Ruminococcaceae bacterium]|nr:hypothetical protein [Oscillospiraceae bacterium]